MIFLFQTETTFVDKLQKSRLPKLHSDFSEKNPTNLTLKKYKVDYYL